VFGDDLFIELPFELVAFLLGEEFLDALGLFKFAGTLLVDDRPLLLFGQEMGRFAGTVGYS
jgi:hypothetical protein